MDKLMYKFKSLLYIPELFGVCYETPCGVDKRSRTGGVHQAEWIDHVHGAKQLIICVLIF